MFYWFCCFFLEMKQEQGDIFLSCPTSSLLPRRHGSSLQLFYFLRFLVLFSNLLNMSKYFGASSYIVQPCTQMLFALYCRDGKLDIYLNGCFLFLKEVINARVINSFSCFVISHHCI